MPGSRDSKLPVPGQKIRARLKKIPVIWSRYFGRNDSSSERFLAVILGSIIGVAECLTQAKAPIVFHRP